MLLILFLIPTHWNGINKQINVKCVNTHTKAYKINIIIYIDNFRRRILRIRFHIGLLKNDHHVSRLHNEKHKGKAHNVESRSICYLVHP